MNRVRLVPVYKTDLWLDYENDDFINGKWYFTNKDNFGRKFNVVIVEDGILTTREINRISSYNHNKEEQGFDDLDIINVAWEQGVCNRYWNDNESADLKAIMKNGKEYRLKLHVHSINKNHFHFVVHLL